MTFFLRLQIFHRTRLLSHFLFAGTMGTTSCNVTGNLTSEQNNTLLIIFGSTGGAGVIVCMVSILLVFVKKLYKKLVYRLALYQVLSSLLFSTLEVLQLVFRNYHRNPEVYRPFCLAVAFLDLWSMWMKLCFAVSITFHLFCSAMCSRDMTKYELAYVLTSLLLVPLPVSIVPFVTNSYGHQS